MGSEVRGIRGDEIAMIFQEPMKAFSPVHTIGDQIMEGILLHATQDKKEAYDIAVETLSRVQISNVRQRMQEYPHQLSGGMRQRAMIAMALACRPAILIADEPTTALDVTVQAQVLRLMRDLQRDFGMALIFITHDMGVIAKMADEVGVMYLGRMVEFAEVDTIFHEPAHPYTQELLRSIPALRPDASHAAERHRGHGTRAAESASGLWFLCPLQARHPRRLQYAKSAGHRTGAQSPGALLPLRRFGRGVAWIA